MKIKYFCLTLTIIICLVSSCKKNESCLRDLTTVLLLNKANSTIDDSSFIMDKMNIINYADSILIYRFYEKDTFRSIYLGSGNKMYELRQQKWSITDKQGIDTILTFSLKDTSFINKSSFEIPMILFQLSLTDSKYKIERNNDGYKTTKQSLTDTTYKEVFYYDDNFHIYKFINIYKKNKCIYERSSFKK